MVDGYFGGGLAEAEREAAARRQKERQSGIQDGDPEARNDMAMQTAGQAEADARLFAGQLLAARRSGNQEIYERTERTLAPMLARQVAVAIAGRKRIPFDQAMGEAEPMVQAIVAKIRGMSGVASVSDLMGNAESLKTLNVAPGRAPGSIEFDAAETAQAALADGNGKSASRTPLSLSREELADMAKQAPIGAYRGGLGALDLPASIDNARRALIQWLVPDIRERLAAMPGATPQMQEALERKLRPREGLGTTIGKAVEDNLFKLPDPETAAGRYTRNAVEWAIGGLIGKNPAAGAAMGGAGGLTSQLADELGANPFLATLAGILGVGTAAGLRSALATTPGKILRKYYTKNITDAEWEAAIAKADEALAQRMPGIASEQFGPEGAALQTLTPDLRHSALGAVPFESTLVRRATEVPVAVTRAAETRAPAELVKAKEVGEIAAELADISKTNAQSIDALAARLGRESPLAFAAIVQRRLDDALNAAMQTTEGRPNLYVGPQFYDQVMGTRAAMENTEAMIRNVAAAQGRSADDAWTAFSRVMEVLRTQGSIPGMGAGARGAGEAIEEASRNIGLGPVDWTKKVVQTKIRDDNLRTLIDAFTASDRNNVRLLREIANARDLPTLDDAITALFAADTDRRDR
ncbi:MAG TPA: hypothetical protein VGA34_11875 [Alteraurantiacibacter sp.]